MMPKGFGPWAFLHFKKNMIETHISQLSAVVFEHITKRFGSVAASDDVSFSIQRGEILSLLGENGSGKTTLMNMLSGIYFPDEGQIYVQGKPVAIRSPKDAFDLRIGMIHQHFKLIDTFTCLENIVLGIKDRRQSRPSVAREAIEQFKSKYGFVLDLDKKVYELSVSEKQTLEILKALYREAEILILDEPTAVLTPIEVERLFAVLKNMRKDGRTIILITHKLNEVMEVSDRVAVLRKGKYTGTVFTHDTNERQLTDLMVGEKVTLNIDRPDPVNPYDRLIVEGLTLRTHDGISVLDNVTFTARSGEILGVAGISGSGQKELLESIAGLTHLDAGAITYIKHKKALPENLRNKTPKEIRQLGVSLSFVPEDRLGMGLVGRMNIVDNVLLRGLDVDPVFLHRKPSKQLAEDIVDGLKVVTPGFTTPIRNLSGGNVQKVLVGREISTKPRVLMTAYPVRGLDINSSYAIYSLLNEQKKGGAAVIFVGEDLDVLLALADRILVLCAGRVAGIVDARTTTKEEVGLLMTGGKGGNHD